MRLSDRLERRRQRNPNKINIMNFIWKYLHPFVVNWKTTFAGIGMIAGGVASIARELTVLADGGTPDMEILSMSAGTIVGGFGLIAGRDADKTSSQSLS
jgi:hypothetical protein